MSPKKTSDAPEPVKAVANPLGQTEGTAADPDHIEELAAAASIARYEAIARAAYYRAERRGFAAGHELEDWLAAQHEIDADDASTGSESAAPPGADTR